MTPTQRATSWIARVHATAGRPRGSAAFLYDIEVSEVHNVHLDEPRHFARLGHLATGNGRGVVLGGGGAKGLAHIGALRALKESGLGYDRVGGASMGSIIVALSSQNLTPDGMVAVSISGFRTSLMDFTIPLLSLIKAKKFTATMERLFGDWDITDL